MDMNELLEQEKQLVLRSFTHEDAWKLGVLVHDTCQERNLPVAICIEHAGQVVFQCGMPGSTPDNDRWMAGKRNIVRLTNHCSLFNRLKVESRGGKIEDALKLDGKTYISSGGSVPIFVENVGFVGSLTISGMADTDDHALATESILRFAQMQQENA